MLPFDAQPAPKTTSGFHTFGQKISSAGLQPDFSQIKNDSVTSDCAIKRQALPLEYQFDGPLLLGSRKPPEKSYDVCGYSIVSQRLADIIHDIAGDEVRLIPYTVLPNPKSKYPITGSYYKVEMPYLDFIRYEYGDELPLSDWAFKRLEEKGKPFSRTYRPVVKVYFDHDVIGGRNLFESVSAEICAFMSVKMLKACKKVKIIGMFNMTDDCYCHFLLQGRNFDMRSGD